MSTEVTYMDDESIEELFSDSDSPEFTPTAENLNPQNQNPKPTVPKPSKKEEKAVDLEEEEEEAPIEITEEDKEELFDEPEEDLEDKTKKSTPSDKSKTKTPPVNYKATLDYLVEQGIWQDFEERESLEEITEEQYVAIMEQQDAVRIQNLFNEKIEKTGNIGKAIIQHIENGGNPQDIINLFRERRSIENLNLKDADDQEAAIRAYMEYMDEDDDDIEDFITTAKDKGSEYFASLAEKRYKKLLDINASQVNSTIKEQEEYKNHQKALKQKFDETIRQTINKAEDFTATEKREIEKFLLQTPYKLENGTPVTGFYAKMLEIQKDPIKYIKLAKFVSDIDAYEKKISKKAEKETIKKTFNFINSSQSEKTTKTSLMPEEDNTRRNKNPFEIVFKN